MKRTDIARVWLNRFIEDTPGLTKLPEEQLGREIVYGFIRDLKTIKTNKNDYKGQNERIKQENPEPHQPDHQ
jgi:hypothetical protein